MDLALAVSALLMGLAGGPHCAAMCGAAYGGIARQGGPEGAGRAMLALQLGRLASYAAAGGLVAASMAWLGSLREAAPLLKPIWTLLHVSAVALGLWLLWQGRAPAWLAGAGRSGSRLMEAKPLRFVARIPPTARAGAIGACWAAMPCGLLQSALLVAALASGPLQGAGVMAVFAIGSAVSLWLAPWLWLRLQGQRGQAAARSTLAVRLAGVLLIAASTFALVHGLREAIDQALCLPSV
ncbi:MAG: sulfite exporter TauE/SafE family protein [Bacteriovorax sp.]|nr:sulfite exporter TauE/SafE family protein [Rhizobacter sp.]